MALASLVAGCGSEEPAELDPAAWRTVVVFALEDPTDPLTGEVLPVEDPTAARRETLDIARARLAALGDAVPAWGARLIDAGRLEAGFATLDDAQRGVVLDTLGTRGVLEFCVEVMPQEVLEARRDGADAPVGRPSPWPGDAAALEAFRASEAKRWMQARAAGVPYEPTRPPFLVVPAAGLARDDTDSFRVLERPARRIDQSIFSEAVVIPAHRGGGLHSALLTVRDEAQRTLGDFTEHNIGMPLAMIHEGEYILAPIIQERLTRNVQITTGKRGLGRGKLDALVHAIDSGILPLQPRLVGVEMRGGDE